MAGDDLPLESSTKVHKDESVEIIADEGDILVQIQDHHEGIDQRYRCSRDVLRRKSQFFNVLLDPNKFNEGIQIDEALKRLHKGLTSAAIPLSKLPVVSVSVVSGLPKTGRQNWNAILLFFRILHDPCCAWPYEARQTNRSQSIALVSLLAILADEFAAVESISIYIKSHSIHLTPCKGRKNAIIRELGHRQSLLAGMTLGFHEWVFQSSTALIVQGYIQRSTALSDPEESEKPDEDEVALWWRLPGGVEEELACRRQYVLDTLSSLQTHFIGLYTSRRPQCRLGYSSSPQCDAYQLGEMIRFFSRKASIRIEGSFASNRENTEAYSGNVEDIITTLRECPSYQIDAYHSHCGLRTRLMPILDTLQPLHQVGICLDCWRQDMSRESWLRNPTQEDWYFRKSKLSKGCREHQIAKAMYTAKDRCWTPGVEV